MIKILIFFSGLLLLSACEPVFSPNVQRDLSRVFVNSIPEHSGFLLRTELQRILSSEHVYQDYILDVSIKTAECALEMGEDAKITLLHVMFKAIFTLMHDGKDVYHGNAVTYYYRTLTPSFYAQSATQAYVFQEGATQLAQQIMMELGKFFASKAKKQSHKTMKIKSQ